MFKYIFIELIIVKIVISGTPGCGKSTISKKLSKLLKIPLIDLKEIIKEYNLEKKGIVDIKKLGFLAPFLKNKEYILEGHLACEIKLPTDFVFLLRCEPSILKRRLEKRGYSKEKISENLISEILDYCYQRIKIKYKKEPIEIDTSKRNINQTVQLIIKAIKQRKKKIDEVDYSEYLKGSKDGKTNIDLMY